MYFLQVAKKRIFQIKKKYEWSYFFELWGEVNS